MVQYKGSEVNSLSLSHSLLYPKRKKDHRVTSSEQKRHQFTMSKSSSPPTLIFCGFLVFFFCSFASITPTAATDHIVGANKGWNPGINYTDWANNHTFYVNDLISFRYVKTQYNVFEVNQSGYDNCTTEGALGNWSSGKDFILLNKAKRYFFICGNGQCYNGMKVSVVVHPLPPPPSAAAAANTSSSNSAVPVFLHKGLVGLKTLVVAVVSIWLGWL